MLVVCLIIPDAQAPDIAGCPLFEKAPDLLDLRLARSGVEQQVTQFGRVGLDIDGALGGPWVALKHQDLVLWATLLLKCIHLAGAQSVRSETA